MRVQFKGRVGRATIRGRTWRGGVASDWSKAVDYTVADRPAVPEVGGVFASPGPAQGHYAELGSDTLVLNPEDDVVIYGRFPIAAPSELAAVFESASDRREIVCEGPGSALRVPTAGKLPRGEWSLTLVRRADGLRTATPLRLIVP